MADDESADEADDDRGLLQWIVDIGLELLSLI